MNNITADFIEMMMANRTLEMMDKHNLIDKSDRLKDELEASCETLSDLNEGLEIKLKEAHVLIESYKAKAEQCTCCDNEPIKTSDTETMPAICEDNPNHQCLCEWDDSGHCESYETLYNILLKQHICEPCLDRLSKLEAKPDVDESIEPKPNVVGACYNCGKANSPHQRFTR